MKYTIAAFYQFVDHHDPEALKLELEDFCAGREFRGTILLANEGINGTIAASETDIQDFFAFLRTKPGLETLHYKRAEASKWPFHRFKIKVKAEIVTLGTPEVNPARKTGVHVKPQEWNALIQDPDTITIDTRNDFEVDLGTFAGACDPRTTSFQEFRDYVATELADAKEKKIAMFCTGGIRCEKASAYMLEQGFENVYQLDGGILQYLDDVPAEESTWQGECFVFDQRVTVDHDLQPGQSDVCHGCWQPIAPGGTESPKYELGISCDRCFEALTEKKRARLLERQRQLHLAQQREQRHLGQVMS